jgi:hypothetical protein
MCIDMEAGVDVLPVHLKSHGRASFVPFKCMAWYKQVSSTPGDNLKLRDK